MAREMNPFALLGEDDQGDNDLTVLLEAAKNIKPLKKTHSDNNNDNNAKQPQPQPAKLPFKPLPPAEAVRAERGRGRGPGRGRGRGGGRFGGGDRFEARGEYSNGFGFEGGRGGGKGGAGEEDGGGFGGGRGGGRGGFGEEDSGGFGGGRGGGRGGFGEEDSGGFGGGRGGGRGGYGEEDGGGFGFGRCRGRGRGRGSRGGGRFGGYRSGLGPDDANGFDRPHQQFETDAPLGQWEAAEGSFVDEQKNMEPEVKKPEEEVTQENAMENKEERKEEEDKEMTLDEYEKLLNDKRKALEALKNEERKVVLDRDFESMQLVDKKKDDGIFMKVNSEKDRLRRKESIEKEDKVRKAVSINEFLKPADGERYYGPPGGRGRGRGRGRWNGDINRGRGGYAGSYNDADQVAAPHIEDPVQFPVLAGK